MYPPQISANFASRNYDQMELLLLHKDCVFNVMCNSRGRKHTRVTRGQSRLYLDIFLLGAGKTNNDNNNKSRGYTKYYSMVTRRARLFSRWIHTASYYTRKLFPPPSVRPDCRRFYPSIQSNTAAQQQPLEQSVFRSP